LLFSSYCPDTSISQALRLQLDWELWLVDDLKPLPVPLASIRGGRTKDALIIDDHPIVREAIKGVIEQSFADVRVTECDGRTSVVNRICGANWAFVVLDMNLPERNGLDILKAVKASGNNVPVVAFSLYSEEQYAARAIRAGAKAYVSKAHPPRELVEVIHLVLSGGGVRRSPASAPPILSDREVQVLSLLTKGISRKEIAHVLRIGEKTVNTYRARLCVKLKARSLVDLIRYAAEEGFVD
jgi:two-component system, NarL family, invasion response regulator UvrY